MGDRVIISVYFRGIYVISLYDQWGGRFAFKRGDGLDPNFINEVRRLADISNDLGNFLSMLVHWWRESANMRPDQPYHVYLEMVPAVPDHPVIAFDYATREFRLIDYDQLLEDIKDVYRVQVHEAQGGEHGRFLTQSPRVI